MEFYKEIVEKGCYYVDKTLLAKDVIDLGGKVTLFTRPRRFGKTLAQTTLQTFFEDERDRDGNKIDNSCYFEGKKIMNADEEYVSMMGQYPVIFLTLKSAKQPNFELAIYCLMEQIAYEYDRHSYVLQSSKLSEEEKERFLRILRQKENINDYVTSLAFLSICLEKYHGKQTIILLDEYDVPLENAYYKGFYEEMVDFIRSLFESSLKTNKSLEFAVITGCLRISKESIFTGLNNFKIVSILNSDFSEYFGFTQKEVEEMFVVYGLEGKMDEVKQWYNGYCFGDVQVYNPWSIINYVDTAMAALNAFPKPYWSNTSSNSIVKDLVEQADSDTKEEIEKLIAGGIIEKPVHEDITYEDIYKSKDNLWNFLFFTGYLKKCGQQFENDTIHLKMMIPNKEIRDIYRNTILEWFDVQLETTNRQELFDAILEQNTEKMEECISGYLLETISFYDYAESYYHGFLTGILKGIKNYYVVSNRESGMGRPDIMIKSRDIFRGAAILFEIKYAKNFDEIERKRKEAAKQVADKNYTTELEKEGYQKILKYSICFYKKNCVVDKL